MKTSKSTLTIAREALRIGQDNLPDYRRLKSPKKFTQPQRFACLVVKEFLRLDYRGIYRLLLEWSDLREVLGLSRVPHFTTLCAAAKRLLTRAQAGTLLEGVLKRSRRLKLLARRSRQAAIDSTGLESRHVSAYYTRRCQRHSGHYKHRYPKLSAICDTANHLILGAVIDRGPKIDPVEAKATLHDALAHQRFGTLLADAGYESEGFHRLCRERHHIRSIIPTTSRGRSNRNGRPQTVRGFYRQLMKRHFPRKTYGQRWQIETVFSMLKRNLGSSLRARRYQSQNREIRLRLLTHNLALLWRRDHVRYRAGQTLFNHYPINPSNHNSETLFLHNGINDDGLAADEALAAVLHNHAVLDYGLTVGYGTARFFVHGDAGSAVGGDQAVSQVRSAAVKQLHTMRYVIHDAAVEERCVGGGAQDAYGTGTYRQSVQGAGGGVFAQGQDRGFSVTL
jgi:hypothetical protein